MPAAHRLPGLFEISYVASLLFDERPESNEEKDCGNQDQAVVGRAALRRFHQMWADDGAEAEAHDQASDMAGIVDAGDRCAQAQIDDRDPNQVLQKAVAGSLGKRKLTEIKSGDQRSDNPEERA